MQSLSHRHRILQSRLRSGALLFAAMILLITGAAAMLDLPVDNPPATTPSIAQGDSVYVHGTATGHPQQGLNVWLIGNNYATVSNIPVESDNSFGYELKKADTENLASGQYFVLVQHPMMNGGFDITYNSGTGEVTNRQLGGGTAIFKLTGAGSLQAPAAAAALVRAVADQNVDDTFMTVTFFIEPPDTLIDPIPEHAVGDRFTITGTTNLAVGDQLMVDVFSSSFKPTSKSQAGEFSGANGMVLVQKGEGRLNRWSFDVDATTFRPDEYIVTVAAVLQDVRGSATFRIGERTPTPTITPTAAPATTATTPVPAPATPGTTPLPTTEKSPAALPVLVTAALIACALRNCRGKL